MCAQKNNSFENEYGSKVCGQIGLESGIWIDGYNCQTESKCQKSTVYAVYQQIYTWFSTPSVKIEIVFQTALKSLGYRNSCMFLRFIINNKNCFSH